MTNFFPQVIKMLHISLKFCIFICVFLISALISHAHCSPSLNWPHTLKVGAKHILVIYLFVGWDVVTSVSRKTFLGKDLCC